MSSEQPELRELATRNPHLKDHLLNFKKITGKLPKFVEDPSESESTTQPNVIYKIGNSLFSHVYGSPSQETKYYAIEPTLTEDEKQVHYKIRKQILDQSINFHAPEDGREFDDTIEELLKENTIIKTKAKNSLIYRIIKIIKKYLSYSQVYTISKDTYRKIRYRLNRDIIGQGPLEPLLRDPNNEDIHVVNKDEVFVDHKEFGMTQTDVDFGSEEEYDKFIRSIAERVGQPVSDSDPIVDSTMPDGSRLNLVYSDDVSVQGPSMTLRQHDETPLTITQITKWGTFSPMEAAYMWIALENDMSFGVAGETASGKTTSLNALLSFIPQDSKIYTAEDTAEVVPPHDAWQQLLVREQGDEGDVSLFDLVKTALRSRPDYIVVGEVRGEEGRMMFQAMQTGHPVCFTFHASDIKSFVQRFTGDPINIPEPYFGNLDIVIFQNFIKGMDGIRRCTGIHEIEGYSDDLDGVVTREVFEWDAAKDEHMFKGMNNSYVLEEKIAPSLGYEDPRRIYNDLELRRRVIKRMIEEGILEYRDVNETLQAFKRNGVKGLPFTVAKPEE